MIAHPLHVAVIGCGIVGATTALRLVGEGHAVTIVEPDEAGGTQAASYGNGAFISPPSVVPMSMPGIWKKVPGYLADPNGPLTIRWSQLPRLAPWLIRYIRAGATVARVEATARALSSLLHDSPARHAAIAAELGQPDLIRKSGLLYIYPGRKEFEAEALSWRLRRDNGVRWIELDSDELHRREPAVGPRYTFGVLAEEAGHCFDPGGYVAAITALAVARGAALKRARALGFASEGGKLRGVRTSEGTLACDRAVICAGIRAKELARQTGDDIPLESERGYHALIASPPVAPRTPIMPSDGKMANTVTRTGLRIAGQVELASVDAPPNWRRIEVLLHHALSTYPGLGARETLQVEKWMGHRPSAPDSLPVIGRASALGDVLYAFGHGHVGLSAAPATAEAICDLIADRPPATDLAPFSPTRFRPPGTG